MDCQVWGAVNEYWRGEGGIVRCRELCMGIGEGTEGFSGVGSYRLVLEREGRDCQV